MPSSDRAVRERALRSAVLAGDARAWQYLYDDAFAALHTYVHWRCAGLRDLADELVQETWLTAVRRVRHFDPERGSFLSWLRGIAANLLRNQLRQARRRLAFSRNGTGHASQAEDEQARSDLAERIALALAELPEHYEAVLRAKYLDQQTVNDIASDWNDTPKAVESLLTRARHAFREAFGKREET
jgi:RNA polymerase sigma-70 factor (ECF subfamily)